MNQSEFRALQAKWDRALKKTGFQDLESSNRDAPLSNRGKIHAKYEDQEPALAERLEHGAAYAGWCQEVLHQLPRSGGGQVRHQIWRLHTDGYSLRMIAEEMDMNFHTVRAVVMKIEEKYRCEKKESKAAMIRTVRRVPTPVLIQVAALMVEALRMSLPLRSAA